MEEFDLKKELEELQNNGWLTEKDKQDILNNTDINECIKLCTSPEKQLIFNAFKDLKPENVKVLILGQDPYPDNSKAHGIAFSYKDENIRASDSLKNIFIALGLDIETTHTNLANWKKQGILLLNTALTYESKSTLDKHTAAWKSFINIIIKKLLKSKNKLVIFTWGNKARDCIFRNTTLIKNKEKIKKDKKTIIEIDDKILLLYCYHPTPINHSNNSKIDENLLFKNQAPEQFKLCNDFLGKDNAINWKDI